MKKIKLAAEENTTDLIIRNIGHVEPKKKKSIANDTDKLINQCYMIKYVMSKRVLVFCFKFFYLFSTLDCLAYYTITSFKSINYTGCPSNQFYVSLNGLVVARMA